MLSPGGATCVVDFALATAFAEIRPEFTHHSEIVGSLPYLAPEQTGRTGRPVDQRADLYPLGATLYELATGEPPFGSGDPLRLTHDHLARVPVAPAQANPAIPEALSEIVMHLLEKEPAPVPVGGGRALRPGALREETGPIGAHDVPPRLLAPSRLVGARTTSRRWRRPSRRRGRACVGWCWSPARPASARRRSPTSCVRP